MTDTPSSQLSDLLIQQSISGLSSEEQLQLDELRRKNNLSDSELQNEIERLELSTAAADLACFQDEAAIMPDHLKDCVLVEAGKFFESQSSVIDSDSKIPAAPSIPKSQTDSIGLNGWMIATIISIAACILLLLNPISNNTPEPTPRVAMQQFLEGEPVDLVDVKMVPGFDANGMDITNSRLVWSDSKQEGYMDFSGLKINRPSQEQYQLWIFDSATQRYPVDGGVFDVTSDNVVIKIDPKIAVNAKFFAVTVERRGGVVVSDRSRIASGDKDLVDALVASSK